MLDYVLVLVWYVACLLLLLSDAIDGCDFQRLVSFFRYVQSTTAYHHLYHNKPNVNSLRHHLGRRDILSAERRPCRAVADEQGYSRRDRKEGFSSPGLILHDILH